MQHILCLIFGITFANMKSSSFNRIMPSLRTHLHLLLVLLTCDKWQALIEDPDNISDIELAQLATKISYQINEMIGLTLSNWANTRSFILGSSSPSSRSSSSSSSSSFRGGSSSSVASLFVDLGVNTSFAGCIS